MLQLSSIRGPVWLPAQKTTRKSSANDVSTDGRYDRLLTSSEMDSVKETIASLQKTIDVLTSQIKGSAGNGQHTLAGAEYQHEDGSLGAGEECRTADRSTEQLPRSKFEGTTLGTTKHDQHNGPQDRSTGSETALTQATKTQQPLANPVIGQRSEGSIFVHCHPLLSISQPEMTRLIQIYEDECGLLYPLVDIKETRSIAERFCTEAAELFCFQNWRAIEIDGSSKESLQRLMVILSIAAVIEGSQSFAFAAALIDEIEAAIDHRPCGVPCNIHLIELLTLMVGWNTVCTPNSFR